MTTWECTPSAPPAPPAPPAASSLFTHVHAKWSPRIWERLTQIAADYGEQYLPERYPNAMIVLQFGPQHGAATRVRGLLDQLCGEEAADLWKPAAAARLIRRTLAHYRLAGGPGLHPDSTADERAAYFAWVDACAEAERSQDLAGVRRLCGELIERLPEVLRWLDAGDKH